MNKVKLLNDVVARADRISTLIKEAKTMDDLTGVIGELSQTMAKLVELDEAQQTATRRRPVLRRSGSRKRIVRH